MGGRGKRELEVRSVFCSAATGDPGADAGRLTSAKSPKEWWAGISVLGERQDELSGGRARQDCYVGVFSLVAGVREGIRRIQNFHRLGKHATCACTPSKLGMGCTISPVPRSCHI